MKKIKVALVQPVQAPYWTERFKQLIKHKEIDIFLILERDRFKSRPGWNPERIPGVTTIILGSQITESSTENADMGYSVAGIRSIPWRLSSVLSSVRPDVLVVCNATQLLCALPARWLLGFNISLIVEDTHHSTRNQRPFQSFFKRLVYRQADSWMPFNRDAADFLKSLGIRGEVYPSSWSVDLDRFTPDEDARGTSGKLTVSFVGALIERKGVIQLLKAWNSIPAEKRRFFELRIAGHGPLDESMRSYIERMGLDDVFLLGQIPYGEVIGLLQSSCLLVLPTLEDVYGMVVLEAMACGCPVITTPYAGSRELIENGATGWIADPMKEGDLARRLAGAMGDIGALKGMGKKARNKAAHYDTPAVIGRFANHLIEMAKK